jgi:hypothetical protein
LQILIDTDTIPAAELGAAIQMLDDVLRIRRAPQPAATNETDGIGSAINVAPLPPAPTRRYTSENDTVGERVPVNTDDDSDLDVEADDDGNVTALTASAQTPLPLAVPPPPGPAVAAEFDSRGYPWDGRIHAANRSRTIKGEWKSKRGVDANLIVAVEASATRGNPTVAATPTIAPSPDASLANTSYTASLPPPPAPPVPAAPSVASPSAQPGTVGASPLDFRGLMTKISAATAAGKLADAQVNAAMASVGLQPTDMAALIGNGPLIASVNAAIDACLGS